MSRRNKMSNLPKVHCGMTDQKAIDYCKKSSMYLKDDIVKLATKCGVTDIANKNRDQLCESIAKAVISGEHLKLDCHDQGKRCKYGNKNEITMLAKKCKVDPNGTKEQVCARIAQSILSLPVKSDTPSSSASSSGTPIGTPPIGTPIGTPPGTPLGTPPGTPIGTPPGTPIGTPPVSQCILKNLTIQDLETSYNKQQLLKICNDNGIQCKAGWSKKDLAKALIAFAGPSPPNPPCLENMQNLPSVNDLMTYKKEVLIKMCDIKRIKYSKSSTKLELAQALFSCTCDDGTPASSSSSSSSSPSPTPTPTPIKNQSGILSDCVSKLTKEETSNGLKQLFKELNLLGLPSQKADMAEYICASKENKKCKAPTWDCEGDFICDISSKEYPNGEGVCLPKKFAESRKPHKTIKLPSGITVIGMPSIINKLEKEIEDASKKLSSTTSTSTSTTHSRPPTTVSSRPPVSHKKQSDNTYCYDGLTYDQLNMMTIDQLKAKFFGTTGSKINISVNGWTKGEIVAYLCAKGQNNYCNSPDWTCEGDYVCDANTNPGICVRPDFAETQLKRLIKGKKKYDSVELNGRKIIGKPEIIKILKEQLQKSRFPSYEDPIRSPSPELLEYEINGKTIYGTKDAIAEFIKHAPEAEKPLTPLVSEVGVPFKKDKVPEAEKILTPVVSEDDVPFKKIKEPEAEKPLTPLVSEDGVPFKKDKVPEAEKPLTPLVSEDDVPFKKVKQPEAEKILTPLVSEVGVPFKKVKQPAAEKVGLSKKPPTTKVIGTPPPLVEDPKTPDYPPPVTPPLQYEKPLDETPVIEKRVSRKKSIKSYDEIPEFLEEIQVEESPDIEELEDLRTHLLQCLGLSTRR